MPRRGGWTRKGRKKPFRYFDARGNRITDPAVLEKIEELAIPPAWRDVWISPRRSAKLQATGVDTAGRVQCYHAEGNGGTIEDLAPDIFAWSEPAN